MPPGTPRAAAGCTPSRQPPALRPLVWSRILLEVHLHLILLIPKLLQRRPHHPNDIPEELQVWPCLGELPRAYACTLYASLSLFASLTTIFLCMAAIPESPFQSASPFSAKTGSAARTLSLPSNVLSASALSKTGHTVRRFPSAI